MTSFDWKLIRRMVVCFWAWLAVYIAFRIKYKKTVKLDSFSLHASEIEVENAALIWCLIGNFFFTFAIEAMLNWGN